MLYVSNFGSNAISVLSIDTGRVIDSISVGNHPDRLALTPTEDFLLALDTQPGDLAVVRLTKLPRGNKISLPEAILKGQNPNKARALVTMVPVGIQPNDLAIKQIVPAK
jgi:YVTN family beta-propeller protein